MPRVAKSGSTPQRLALPAASAGTIAARLLKLGLRHDWDFVLHLPLRYQDETQLVPIASLSAGIEAQIEAEIVSSEVIFRGRRQLLVTVRDDSGVATLRFLNFYSSQVKQLSAGKCVRVFGAARDGFAGVEFMHPRVKVIVADAPLPKALTPIYPSGEGIPQSWLRKRIDRALRDVDISDVLPPALRMRWQLGDLASALDRLHHPPPDAEPLAFIERSDPAWRRLKFDELLAQQLCLRSSRAKRALQSAPPMMRGGPLTQRLLASLPFQLTAAQQRVWGEVERNLAQAEPMHRLVQGDVGSGKTVIAALAAVMAIDSGYQAALMAPTEILAEQHFQKLEPLLAPLGVSMTWLSGRLAPAAKRAAQQAAAGGAARMIIGTHALIQDAVSFERLGLAIVDEQHRFGVAQRLALRSTEAPGMQPHMLMLSATPIPRTLAMTYLADLDVSMIDELPPGRRAVVTKLASARRREEVMNRIRDEVASGRQAYWVCPLVELSDMIEATAATETFAQIQALLPELRVGLLHGQLSAAEKAASMARFVAREIDLMVATTVIEVGVDVANATLMVIEHAERFGLAQLHQLRGRVGRGGDQSYCILLFDEPLSDIARERLKVIYETTDGFEVARRDLVIRGPGEFLGSRQSGVPLLRFADLEFDTALVDLARDAAAEMLEKNPEAAREHVRRWFEGRQEFLGA